MSVRTPRIDAIDTRNDRLEKNYIINGDMRIAQRGTSFAAAATDTYSLDRWVYRKNGTMVHTLSQDTDVPTFAQAGYLFQNSYRANLTTAQTSIAAGNFALIRQRIEGYNWANIAQKAFSISFWVKATLPGIYYVSCANTGGDQCIASTYTINSVSTWEFKTVSIAASPSSGTWNYTNGTGIAIDFVLACGSTFFSPTPGSWTTTQSFVGSNQVNGVNTGATDFRITGVSITEGTTNTKFSTFARTFQGELEACQRYYAKTYSQGAYAAAVTNEGIMGCGAQTNGAAAISFQYPVEMRIGPTYGGTFLLYNPATGAVNSIRGLTGGSGTAASSAYHAGTRGMVIGFTAPAQDYYGAHYIADVEL